MQPLPIEDEDLTRFLEEFYAHFHYDFRGYAISSLRRRLAFARDSFKCNTLSQLMDTMRHAPELIDRLLDILTIQVSELFRDPEYFKMIRTQIVPYLKTYPSLKIWIAGCSTGEEYYSLAILFKEEGLFDRTIFYATDINNRALATATSGSYAMDRLELFTKNYTAAGGTGQLSDYYSVHDSKIVMHESLRKNSAFFEHNLASDNVFSETHFISCRNVLIYFLRELQDRAIGLFNESLVNKGFLGLGSHERLHFSVFNSHFSDFSYAHRISQKKAV